MTRVRIAPSPTGFLHIGTARTALFNFLFAKKNGGKFILRVEDTDKNRSMEAFDRDVIEGLQWLGLQWDEGPDVGGEYAPYRQSQRIESHKQALQQLLERKYAYLCYCTTEELEADRTTAEQAKLAYRYNGRCRTNPPTGRDTAVVRFRLPEENASVQWNDHIRGSVTVNISTLDDFIIARDMNDPLYNFAVVVDDANMKITYVIRGEDHISNTPKQILIGNALGCPIPEFAHIPLILNTDRTKMSKRKNEVSMNRYRELGYLPEAIVNFLALLGWNPGTEQELFTLEQLSEVFDLRRVQKSGAIFNNEKLRWFNQQYLAKRTPQEFETLVTTYLPKLHADVNVSKAIAVVRPRLSILSEVTPQLESFMSELPPLYEGELLLWPKAVKKSSLAQVQTMTKKILSEFKEFLKRHSEWTESSLELSTKSWIAEHAYGVGDTLWPLRVALSGQKDSPTPFELMEICGRGLTVKRIEYAINILEK